MKKRLVTASMVFILSVPFLFGGCNVITGYNSSVTDTEGFAIYLTRDDIPPAQMETLSHIELAEAPVISGDDVVSYDWETHEIEITPTAYDRVKQGKKLVPGESFVVCVNKQPVYWGAFWSLLSSQSFDGITIMRPFNTDTEDGYFINITRGYPSEGFYDGEDPRSDSRILESLKKAGKLLEVGKFEIYLSKDIIPIEDMKTLTHIDISDKPFISFDDIAAYYWDTHDIELTPAAYERMQHFEVNPGNAVFAVCIDGEPVYWGRFHPSFSSYFYDGIMVTVQPVFPVEGRPNAIHIAGPRPPDNAPPVEDMRKSNIIKASLQFWGKLK